VKSSRRPHGWKRIAVIIVTGAIVLPPLAYLGGGFLYSFVVNRRVAAWESTIEHNADGVRLDSLDYQVGDGNPVLLLVHGFGDSPVVYREMSRELASRGFTCKAIRLPGFAERPQTFSEMTWHNWVDRVREEISQFREAGRPVWLVSHSLGGTVTLKYATDYDDIEGVISMAPLIEVSNERSPLMPPRTWFNLLTTSLPFMTIVENPFPRDLRRAPPAWDPGHDHFFSINVFDELFQLMDEVNAGALRIGCPLLLILSPSDKVVNPAAAKAFLERTSANPAEVIMAENSGHVIPMDQEWVEVCEWIEEFVNRSAIPKSPLSH
jgi:esterase/lipase